MMLPVAWFIFVFIVSVMPVTGPRTDLPADKIAHFIVYGIAAILVYRECARRIESGKALFLSVAISSAYGAMMELLQSFLPSRSFSTGDMAANAAGALVFCLLYVLFTKAA